MIETWTTKKEKQNKTKQNKINQKEKEKIVLMKVVR